MFSGDPQYAPPGGHLEVALAEESMCTVGADRTARCWQLPAGHLTSPPPGAYTTVSAGHRHGCAIRDDGTVTCWGADHDVEPYDSMPHVSMPHIGGPEESHSSGDRWLWWYLLAAAVFAAAVAGTLCVKRRWRRRADPGDDFSEPDTAFDRVSAKRVLGDLIGPDDDVTPGIDNDQHR